MAIASNVSAFWILVANAWMQHPVGFAIRNGRAELTDFFAVITQRFALLEFVHTLGGAYILAGFFVLGISAWHLARKRQVGLFKKSFRVAAGWTLVFAVFEMVQGHMNAEILHDAQPTKLAAIESHWETQSNAPLYLLSWPDSDNQRNSVQAFGVPSLLSLLAGYSPSTEVKGLREWPAERRPPVLPVFLSFRAMVGLGFVFLLIGVWAFRARQTIETKTRLLRILPWLIPLPYLANQLGWTIAELGRQPWIVYGMMRTSDAVVAAGSLAGRDFAGRFHSRVFATRRGGFLPAVEVRPTWRGRKGRRAGRRASPATRITVSQCLNHGGHAHDRNNLVRNLGRGVGGLLHARRI